MRLIGICNLYKNGDRLVEIQKKENKIVIKQKYLTRKKGVRNWKLKKM